MADHLVTGAHGEPLDVPVPDERLPGAAGSVKPPCTRTVSMNRDSCVVVATYAQHDAAGPDATGAGVEAVPGREHVEDDPVDLVAGRRERVGEVADGQLPRGVALPIGGAEELVDVPAGHVGEVLATFVRRQPAVRADRPEQGAGERTGPDAGLDHVGAGEDVGERDDLRGVLGIDDGGATGHGDDELRQERAEDEVLPASGRRDGEALLAADQLVVLEVPAVGEEAFPGLEADVVAATLAVGQADPLAGFERAAMNPGEGLGCDVVEHARHPSRGPPEPGSEGG